MKRKTPKKIAIVVGVFPSISEAFIVNQIEFLIDAGLDVHILATRNIDAKNSIFRTKRYNNLITKTSLLSNNGVLPETFLKRIKKALQLLLQFTHTVSLLKTFNIFKYGKDALNFKAFYRFYYQHFFSLNKYDIVHIHFGDNGVHLKNQIKNFDKKVVLSFHGYDAHKFNAEFYKPLSAIKHIELTVNTNYTKSKIVDLGFANHHIHTLPVGLDTRFFKPQNTNLGKDKNQIKLLFVGRLIELKAPLVAIKLFEKVIQQSNNIELLIVGNGPKYDECRSYIQKNKLTNYVELLGVKSQNELKDIYNTSHIFIFPGITDSNGKAEAQGLVLQEAQAMALPVVTSDVGGISEGLISDKTGFLVNENHIDGFVTKILWLINNPKARDDMGKSARAFVKENYDSTILGKKLLSIYKNVVRQ